MGRFKRLRMERREENVGFVWVEEGDGFYIVRKDENLTGGRRERDFFGGVFYFYFFYIKSVFFFG